MIYSLSISLVYVKSFFEITMHFNFFSENFHKANIYNIKVNIYTIIVFVIY